MWQLWQEYGGPVLVTVCLVALVACGVEGWRELRRWYHRRAGESGRMFPVVPLQARTVLPHEDDGPGTYLVTGVLERSGTPTRFQTEASGVPDAVRKALERGVSPAAVTKQRQ